VQYQEGAQAQCTLARAISGGMQYTLAADSLPYGTQTERGCWSQYTPGYQAEPIIISRYIIALYGECVIYTVREYFHLR